MRYYLHDRYPAIDELDPGDYVMVHAGMAIAKITDNDADETDDILEDLN